MDLDRITSSPFVIGGLGALVALRFAPGIKWWERATNVACGALAAGYGAPALTEWLQFKSPAMSNAAAFVVGLLAMSLIAAVLQALRDPKVSEILLSWLPRRNP